MLVLYYPNKEPIPRNPNALLYLDKVLFRPAPYVNEIPDYTWTHLKKRDDVLEALQDSKFLVEVNPPKADPSLAYAERKAYLESAKWQDIRDIANELGITERPEGGWNDAVPDILRLEFPQ